MRCIEETMMENGDAFVADGKLLRITLAIAGVPVVPTSASTSLRVPSDRVPTSSLDALYPFLLFTTPPFSTEVLVLNTPPFPRTLFCPCDT